MLQLSIKPLDRRKITTVFGISPESHKGDDASFCMHEIIYVSTHVASTTTFWQTTPCDANFARKRSQPSASFKSILFFWLAAAAPVSIAVPVAEPISNIVHAIRLAPPTSPTSKLLKYLRSSQSTSIPTPNILPIVRVHTHSIITSRIMNINQEYGLLATWENRFNESRPGRHFARRRYVRSRVFNFVCIEVSSERRLSRISLSSRCFISSRSESVFPGKTLVY